MAKLRNYSLILFSMVIVLLFMTTPGKNTSAQLADGTYSIQYSVIKPDNGSASMADGYFSKPATLTIDKGKYFITLNVTSSSIKEFQVRSGGSYKNVSNVSKKGEVRTVKFAIDSISNTSNAKMHVIANESYDHWYTVRLSFNENSLKVIKLSDSATNNNESKSSAAQTKNSAQEKTNNAQSAGNKTEQINNPKTGDSASIVLLSLLFIGSLVLIGRKIKFSK